jgi:HAD superfamily hydrolase (TIGR01490 family)
MNRSALFLDLDQTLVSVSTEKFFVRELYRSGRLGPGKMFAITAAFVRHALGLIPDYSETKRSLCRTLLRHESVEECITLFDRVFDSQLRSMMHHEMVALAESFRSRQLPVFIISGSLDFMVRPFASVIRADAYFGIETIQKDGRFTGELRDPVLFGEAKAHLVRRLALEYGIDLCCSTACSDSDLDVPMLTAVGNPIAFNPSRRLKRHAKRQGWTIIYPGAPQAGSAS